MKKFVIIGLLFAALTSCTSSSEKQEAGASDTAESLAADSSLSGDSGTPVDNELDNVDSAAAETTTPPAEALPDQPMDANNQTPAPDAQGQFETPPADVSQDASMTPAPDMGAAGTTEAIPETTEAATTVAAASTVSTASTLQKVPAKPWIVGKTVYNAVYFARPGDTVAGISAMIYGSDKSDIIRKGNTQLKKREPKPGEKVYYNSPMRPDDQERMMVYYEDIGMPAETYSAQAGDNLKKVSKQLLGYDNAWKEVWASNTVESKTKLDEGTQLRYWKGSGAGMAPTELAPKADAKMPMKNNAMNPPAEEMPPPPPNDFAPPPEMPNQGMAANDLPPPPPMEAPQMAPPPPPPPVVMNTKKVKNAEAAQGDDQMIILAAVIVVALGGAGLLLMRRRRKQKEFDQRYNNTSTQVG